MGRKSGDRSSSYIFVPETATSPNSTSPRQTSSENSSLRRMSHDNSSPRQTSFDTSSPRRTSCDNSSPRRSSVIRKSPQRKMEVSTPRRQVDEIPSTRRSVDEKSSTIRQSEGRSSPSKEDPSNPPPSTSGTPRSKGQPRRAKRNAGQGTMQNRSSADDKQTIELLKTTVADLRSQLVASREAREDEKQKIKTIRREAQADLRRAREEEQERAECMLQELRNRSEHEKNLACAAKEEYLEKQFQAEFTRFANRKDEELKKVKADDKRAREEMIIQVRESQRAATQCQCSPHLSPTGSLDRPRPPGPAMNERMTQELLQLRGQKRKLEEILQIATETERRKAHEIRCIHEEHDEEIKQLRKMAKNDAYKLMEELRAKDKQIGDLERQVQKLASKDMSASTSELEERASGREKRLNLKLAELQEKLRQEGQDGAKRERELQEKIKKLTEFNEQLKATMIRRLSEADKSIAPLKSKNRQFVSRNLELTSRNRELQQTLRQLTIEYNQQKEQKEKEQLKETLQNSKSSKNSTAKTDDVDGSHKRKLDFSKRRQNSDKISPGPGRSRPNQDKPQGRTKTLVKKKEKKGCGDGVCVPECCPDYHRLYTHLQKEFTELQRSYQLLQTHAAIDSIADPQREEKSKISLKNDLKVALAKIEDLEKVVDGSAVETKLVEEKKEIYALNLGLSEKIRYLQERENRLMAELQDSKDQSELLEFRVLELEECQEKQSQHNLELLTPMKETRESWTETESTDIDFFNDSGCPSVTTDEDIQEIQQDFRNEKIADTKNRLHALIGHVHGTTSKSLLLQSVALFETLLNKIHELQNENETLKAALVKIPSGEKVANNDNHNDDIIIENEELKRSKETLAQEIKTYQNELQQYKQKCSELTEELNKNQNRMQEKEEVHRKLSDMQSKVEVDLKKQVNILNNKLDSTLIGCQSESEMLEESMLKVSGLERFVEELKSRLESFRSENNELKEQLSSALEHHTTKSSGSLGSDFDSNKVPSMLSDVSEESNRKTTGSSSGIASDLSDSEMEPLDMRSRSVSPEKSRSRFLESGMFDSGHYVNMETQTNEQYIKEITSLTEEIEKLTAFRDMIENKMILPITAQPVDQCNYSIHKEDDESTPKESTPIIEMDNLENDLHRKIDVLEKSSNLLTNKYQQLLEEKCELEEAENDSRLKAQVFEQQLIAAENKARDLNDALVVEKKAVKHLRNDLERLRDKEYDTGNEIGYLEVLTQQYEQRICELEEKEHHLKEGLQLLLKAVTIYSYVNMVRFSNTVQRRALGYIKLLVDTDTQTIDLKAVGYTPIEGSQRRPASTELDEEPETKKAKIYETSRNISDLENSIETLQRGKRELEYALITVTAEKEAMAESLEGSHEDKIERIITLEDKIAELLHMAKISRDQYHKERAYMKNQYESRIADLTDKERKGLQRIAELEDSLTNVRNELEIVTINLNAAGNSSIDANEAMMNAEKCKAAESKLEEIIADHQKKESAYRKTIEEADGIMARLEYSYQGKIKDLEDEKQQILDRITYYKENELRLKQTIKSNGKDDMQRVGELLEQLMEVEKSELTLKEKVYHMEKSASELNLKLLQEQKSNSDLRNDIRDQEELLTRIGLAESENQSLLCEINHLKEYKYKNQELQQSEEFLQGRVNELEQMENFLTEALSQSEQNYNLREKKLQDRIACLEMEIQDSHSSASSYEFAFDKLRGEDNTLKTELDNLKLRVAELTSELQQKATDSHENETSLRTELNKARQQLALANNQLEEIDGMNSQLREDLETMQHNNRDKEITIENLKNKCEQSTIKWNLQLEEKESHMRDLKERLESREVSVTSEEELDDLATHEGGLVHVTKEVEMAAVTVQACPSCSDDVSARLHSAAAQLATLSSVICGQHDSLDSPTDIQALRRCESEEILSMPGYSQMDDEVSQALESQLEELQVKFGRMEEEMTIVSEESKELQERLEAREEEIKEKSNQLVDLTVLVDNLRQLNETSAENIELEKQRSLCLKEEAESLTVKCGSKNRLIKVLAETLASGSNLSTPAIISAIKTGGEGVDGEDFTPDTVCQLVAAAPNRKISKKLVSDEEMKKIEELKSLASKEFRDRSPIKEHDVNLTLLPPENFRITRRVGSDGLLVAWTTPEDDEVTGYMIYIDDVPHQRVRSASRTKALLHGLAMDQELTIRIHSTNQMDQLSQTLTLVYDPSLVLPEDKKKNKDNTVEQ